MIILEFVYSTARNRFVARCPKCLAAYEWVRSGRVPAAIKHECNAAEPWGSTEAGLNA